jgi:hypothetical protein
MGGACRRYPRARPPALAAARRFVGIAAGGAVGAVRALTTLVVALRAAAQVARPRLSPFRATFSLPAFTLTSVAPLATVALATVTLRGVVLAAVILAQIGGPVLAALALLLRLRLLAPGLLRLLFLEAAVLALILVARPAVVRSRVAAVGIHDAIVMLGVLEEVLRRNPIPGGLSIAGEPQILLPDLVGIAANADVRPSTIERLLLHRHVRLALTAAARPP